MRAMWKGAVSFGLVNVPVKLYSATENHDISFRQVHPEDGGRIKYKRVCDLCGKEIPFSEIAKGYESADGRLAVLARQMGGDAPLMAGIVAFTTLASVITIPLLLLVFGLP